MMELVKIETPLATKIQKLEHTTHPLISGYDFGGKTVQHEGCEIVGTTTGC